MRIDDDIREAFSSIASEAREARNWPAVEARIRRARQRRFTALAAGLAAIIASSVLAVPRIRTEGSGLVPADPAVTWRTYHHADGWSIDYPASWRLQPFRHESRISHIGAAASNVKTPLQEAPCVPSQGCPKGWSLHGLPDDLVIVQFSRAEGGPAMYLPWKSGPDSPVPLRLEGVARSTDSIGRVRMGKSVVLTGTLYAVNVWLGPGASASDRTIADRIVASIRAVSEGPFAAYGRLALNDPATRARLEGKRYRIVQYARYDKDDGNPRCLPRTCIVVRIYVYSDDRAWSVWFDPDSRAIIRRGAESVTERLTVSPEEREIAHRIADANADVRRELGATVDAHSHPAVAREIEPHDGNPCGARRCAKVIYEFPDEHYIFAFVNLSTEQVIKVTRR